MDNEQRCGEGGLAEAAGCGGEGQAGADGRSRAGMWGKGAGMAAPLAEERGGLQPGVGPLGLEVGRDLVRQDGCVPGVWN